MKEGHRPPLKFLSESILFAVFVSFVYALPITVSAAILYSQTTDSQTVACSGRDAYEQDLGSTTHVGCSATSPITLPWGSVSFSGTLGAVTFRAPTTNMANSWGFVGFLYSSATPCESDYNFPFAYWNYPEDYDSSSGDIVVDFTPQNIDLTGVKCAWVELGTPMNLDNGGYFKTDSNGLAYLTVYSTSTNEISSNITASTTWRSNNVWEIFGNVTIDSGVTLTIAPGTKVKFATATSSLIVNGTLNAEGSAASTTVFSSLNGTSSSPGDWGGIEINSGGQATFKHSFVGYGGSVDSSNAMIYNNGGVLNIASSTIAYSGSTYGIKNSSGTTTITATDISFNNYGLYLNGGNATINATSTLHDNTNYSVYNNTSATSSLTAEGNYWATSTGPYNAKYNPSGTTTSAVSDYVDFSPWIGQLHYITQDYFNCLPNNCSSVHNNAISIYATSTYQSALDAATSTWNQISPIQIVATSSSSGADTLLVQEINNSDVSFTAQWLTNGSAQDTLQLNSYYLSGQGTDLRQNTIEHELGHALGLYHSYLGNIMYSSQTAQTALGNQDVDDYHYLWGN